MNHFDHHAGPRLPVALVLVLLGLAACQSGPEETGPYSDLERWLCHPKKEEGPCRENLDVSEVAADGAVVVKPFEPASNPPADCFYVYPTVSMDTGSNADLEPGEEEVWVTRLQAARLGAHCRIFAPVYRQVSVEGIFGAWTEEANALAYGDVVTAFDHYQTFYNEGRPFFLIGHSQGSTHLKALLQERFDRTASIPPNLLAAYLIGSTVEIPEDATVGGDFAHLPVCSSTSQTGCLLSYAAYRATNPPGAGALFATTKTEGRRAACINPGAPSGGRVPLRALLPSSLPASADLYITGTTSPYEDSDAFGAITTPFYSVPGLLEGECVEREQSHYLEVTIVADPDDPRADNIGGDFLLPGWGLHMVDINLVLDDLSALMEAQSQAYGE